MATRLVGVESTAPRLPQGVITASQGTSATDLAAGNVASTAATDATTKANAAQAYAIQRANHTGTQAIATVTDLQTELDSKLDVGGGTMTGPLELAADPAEGLEAATKQYVDTHVGMAGVSNTATFSYNTTTTEPPTGNQLRLNNTTFTAATRLWVSQTTVDGLDISIGLARILTGHQIYFQDRDNAAAWVKYNVTADGVDDGTYYDFAVSYHSGPGGIPAGQVEFQAVAPGTVGVPPGGTAGQVLAKTSATDYAVGWTDAAQSWDVIPVTNNWAMDSGPPGIGSSLSGDLLFLPLRCPACQIDRLGIDVTTAGTAGAIARLGIYANHTSRLAPEMLVYDAGTVDATTTGFKSLTFSAVTWTGGLMWLAVAIQGSGGSVSIRTTSPPSNVWTIFSSTPSNLLNRTYLLGSTPSALPSTISSASLVPYSLPNPKIIFHTA